MARFLREKKGITLSIVLVLLLITSAWAVYEVQPWKDQSGTVGATDRRFTAGYIDALYVASSIVFEGATDDAYEITLTMTEPATSDKTITFGNTTGTVLLSTAGVEGYTSAVWGADGGFIFEGATQNTYETTLTATDATADRAILLPDLGGVILTSVAGTTDYTSAVWGVTGGFSFEGATQDASETTLTATDPSADRAILLPDLGGVLLTSIAGTTGYTNAVWGVTGGFSFEGATQDAFETTVTVTDPTADRAIIFPDGGGVVLMSTAGALDIANAVTGVTGGFEFEGSSADAYETTLTATNPTAARTIALPDASGIVQLATVTVSAKTAEYTITAAQTGQMFTNEGATADIIFNLPDAAAGLNYIIANSDSTPYSVTVNPVTADTILGSTNAAGDAVINMTQGGIIHVYGGNASQWYAYYYGTWADIN